MIKIVEPEKGYFEKIRDIWVSDDVVANTMANKNLTVLDIEKKLIKDGVKSFVAINNNVPVGCLRLTFGVSKKSHCSEFVVFVDPNFRRKGVAELLLKNAINYLKEKGFLRIELSVFSDNKSAIKLYKKLGFVKEGVRKNALKRNNDFFDEILMAKFLN